MNRNSIMEEHDYSTSAKVYALDAIFRVFVIISFTIHSFHSYITQ